MKGTTVSEASRRDAHGGKSRMELEQAIADIEQLAFAKRTQLTGIENELMSLKTKYRIASAGYFPPEDYQKLCDRQNEMSAAKRECEVELAKLKSRRIALRNDMNLLRPSENENGQVAAILASVLSELKAIRKLLAKQSLADSEASR